MMKIWMFLMAAILAFTAHSRALQAETQLDKIERDLEWLKDFHRGQMKLRGEISVSLDMECLNVNFEPSMLLYERLNIIRACQNYEVAELQKYCVVESMERNSDCFQKMLTGKNFQSADPLQLEGACRDWKFDCGD